MLTACVGGNNTARTALTQGQKLDAELAQEKNIIKTLHRFWTGYANVSNSIVYSDNGNARPVNTDDFYLSENIEMTCCENDIWPKECDRNYWWEDCLERNNICKMDEDECKLFLRNNKHHSKVGYFNYKRYLPEGLVNNDDEFLKLVRMYKLDGSDYKKKEWACETNYSLTAAEKEQCLEKANEWLIAYATSGGAGKQIKQEAERARATKAKQETQIADCKQAKRQADKRREEIENGIITQYKQSDMNYKIYLKDKTADCDRLR